MGLCAVHVGEALLHVDIAMDTIAIDGLQRLHIAGGTELKRDIAHQESRWDAGKGEDLRLAHEVEVSVNSMF